MPAGPGTGKSVTLVTLIGEMVKEKLTPRVRLLTFTRAATAELANKLEEHPSAIVERPSTIHSFAISVLLRNDSVGDPAPAAPDRRRLGTEGDRPAHSGPACGRGRQAARRLAPRARGELGVPNPARAAEITAAERSRFIGAWQEHRGVYGYTLLSELPYALRGVLRDHLDLNGVNYDVLLVDEYQDLNSCDVEVLKRIADVPSRVEHEYLTSPPLVERYSGPRLQ